MNETLAQFFGLPMRGEEPFSGGKNLLEHETSAQFLAIPGEEIFSA